MNYNINKKYSFFFKVKLNINFYPPNSLKYGDIKILLFYQMYIKIDIL